MSDEWWRDQAACRNIPTRVFFPEVPGPNRQTYEVALAICAGCDVRAECLEFILDVERPGERYGVFGGTTPNDRSTMPRRNDAPRRARAVDYGLPAAHRGVRRSRRTPAVEPGDPEGR